MAEDVKQPLLPTKQCENQTAVSTDNPFSKAKHKATKTQFKYVNEVRTFENNILKVPVYPQNLPVEIVTTVLKQGRNKLGTSQQELNNKRMQTLEQLPAKENKNMIQTFCINKAIPHTLVHFKDPNFSRDSSLISSLKGNEKRRTDVTVMQTDYLKPWKQTLDLMYTPVLSDRNNRYGP